MSAFGWLSDCIVDEGGKVLRRFDPATELETSRARFDLATDPRELEAREVGKESTAGHSG